MMTILESPRAMAWLVVLLMASASVAQVPDPSMAAKVYPEVLKAGPPPIIKPGTRLIYYGGSATIAGSRTKLVPDDKGNWVDPKTGQKYSERDVQGSGGVGYTVARVGHVDRDVAVINSSSYLLDPLAKTVSYTGGGGMVTNAGAGSDFWVHPAVLKNIKEMREPGNFIGRVPYVIGNRKFNAIRFQNDSANGHTTYVYDLDSGLMIFFGSSNIAGGVLTPPGPDGRPGVGAGNTFLSHSMLVEVKDVDIPWKDAPVPQWVNQFRELRYTGGITTAIQGVNPMTQAMSVIVSPKARGNGWLRYTNNSTVQVYGLPPQQGVSEGAGGSAGLGGLWVPPQGMANLKVGQVLDSIDILKTKTVVTDIGRGYITLSEIGQLHRSDANYDTTTGLMTSLTLQQKNQLSVTTTQLRLDGQR